MTTIPAFVQDLVDLVDADHSICVEYHFPRHLIRGLPRDRDTVVQTYTVTGVARVRDIRRYRVEMLQLPGYGESTEVYLLHQLVRLLSVVVGDTPRGMLTYSVDDEERLIPV